jgi:hypothetical protein
VPEFALQRSGQLAVVVKRGVGLKNVESMMYKMDPYVQVKAGWGGGGGAWQRTKNCMKGHQNPVWDVDRHAALLVFPYDPEAAPALEEEDTGGGAAALASHFEVVVAAYDNEKVGKDKYIGTGVLSVARIMSPPSSSSAEQSHVSMIVPTDDLHVELVNAAGKAAGTIILDATFTPNGSIAIETVTTPQKEAKQSAPTATPAMPTAPSAEAPPSANAPPNDKMQVVPPPGKQQQQRPPALSPPSPPSPPKEVTPSMTARFATSNAPGTQGGVPPSPPTPPPLVPGVGEGSPSRPMGTISSTTSTHASVHATKSPSSPKSTSPTVMVTKSRLRRLSSIRREAVIKATGGGAGGGGEGRFLAVAPPAASHTTRLTAAAAADRQTRGVEK